jgi:hypothetical protein
VFWDSHQIKRDDPITNLGGREVRQGQREEVKGARNHYDDLNSTTAKIRITVVKKTCIYQSIKKVERMQKKK